MKVVVAGAGNVGRHLAADLTERGHEVTLIEQDTGVMSRARAELPGGVNFLLGDACEPYILEEAKLGQADVIVAATGDDEDNLVTSLLAKQEFAVPRVLARVNHSSNEWMFTEQWGVDAAVSPSHILTALVEEAVTVGDVVRLLKLERGKVTLVELTLKPESKAARLTPVTASDGIQDSEVTELSYRIAPMLTPGRAAWQGAGRLFRRVLAPPA